MCNTTIMHYQISYQMVQTYIDNQKIVSSEKLSSEELDNRTVVKVCHCEIHVKIRVFSDPYIPVLWQILNSMWSVTRVIFAASQQKASAKAKV